MFSQSDSICYTILGKTTDLKVVQKTEFSHHTHHRETKPQKVITKEAGCSQNAVSKYINGRLCGRKKCEEKGAKATGLAVALRVL